MNKLQILAPAKINLTLDITGLRPDGYHALTTIMHQISLTDTLTLTPQKTAGISLQSGHAELPNDQRNLAYRAAAYMFQRYALSGGLSIQIHKRIPIAAGLAGGSTDAAAVIRGIDALFQLHLPLSELCDCGLAMGSDVPFCIAGGTALCTGRGEILQPLPEGIPLSMVLVKPDFSLSTAAVYHQFDTFPALPPFSQEAFLQAWSQRNLPALCQAMQNVLEKASLALRPEIARLMQQLQQLGAWGVRMSGSGPTVFGIFPSRPAAMQAAEVLATQYKECFIAESLDAATPKIMLT